uniref:Coiled-coil domain-containing protein 93 n=1 Tax=Caenorhabditis japonica TaxID=281687 RepID=A0A8R1IRB8_CAEJA
MDADSAALRETEEAKLRLRDDIIAMLAASGYHRARLASLNDYDRIVGGIAWAITRCDDVKVTANLLYDETTDQNIRVRTEQSEKIIASLSAIHCPQELSAHQLLGLDYGALKNVVQWLLRRVLATKENRSEHIADWFAGKGDGYSNRFRRQNYRLVVPTTTRRMKRVDNGAKFELNMDAKCTLAEYECVTPGNNVDVAKEELKEASTKKHVATSMVREMMDQAVVEEEPTEENLSEKLLRLENQLADKISAYQMAKQNNEELKMRFKTVEDTFANTEETVLEQITELKRTFEDTQRRAKELGTYSLAEDQENIKAQQLLSQSTNFEKFDERKAQVTEKYEEKTEKYSDLMREVLELQHRLDGILSVNLSSHYRKRNMERIQNSAEYTEEAKAAVIDYNVTIDILTFSAKITSFINELEQSLLSEPSSQEYHEAFVTYMNNVRTQLGEYHWKAKQTQNKTFEEKKRLDGVRSDIRQKEREVASCSGEMEKLLKLNSTLQELVSSINS